MLENVVQLRLWLQFMYQIQMYLLTLHFSEACPERPVKREETNKIYVNNYNTKPTIFQLPYKLPCSLPLDSSHL